MDNGSPVLVSTGNRSSAPPPKDVRARHMTAFDLHVPLCFVIMYRSPPFANWTTRSQVRHLVRRPMEAVVTTRGDALKLLGDRLPPRRIRLSEKATTSDRNGLVRRINDELRACGCGLASAAMLITLPVSTAVAWWLLGTARWGWLITTAFVATGTAGALSKWVVRRRADMRYRLALRQLADSLQ